MAAAALFVIAVLLGMIGPVTGLRADAGGLPETLTGCIAPVQAGDSPVRMLASPQRFDCRRPAHAWGPGDYWVHFKLAPVADSAIAAPRAFRFMPQWQRALAVVTRDTSGTILIRRLDDRTLSNLVGVGGIVAIPLDLAGGATTDVLVRADGALNASGLIGDPQVRAAPGLLADKLIAVAAIAAFGGLGIGLFCYNLVLWLTIRERFQMTYCLSLFAMMAYVWANSGVMVQQVPAIPHTHRLATSYIMLGFVAALALQFITDFLEPDKVPAQLRRLARNYGAVCVLAGLAVAFCSDAWRHALDRIYALTFIPVPFLVILLTAVAWRRGSRSVRVLAIAWIVPLLSAGLRIGYAFNVIPFSVLVQYSLLIGMSVEALLSSLAMSYRITLITEDRDRARADERAARQLANIDSLTGLLNRRALLEQLLAWGSNEPLRLLLVDIDQFKTINDRHGHLVGDEVLREVAEVLGIRADLNASVARIGGEEFALIGAATDLSEAVALGILADIRGRLMAGEVRVTVSIGMAQGQVRGEDDWRELYRHADTALYQAKTDGRNRAVHAPAMAAAGAPAGHHTAVA